MILLGLEIKSYWLATIRNVRMLSLNEDIQIFSLTGIVNLKITLHL
jgi:hypothetical protein